MSDLSIATPHHHLKAYLARPQGEGPWPGVVVFHDILGLTDVTRGHANWLAKEGYLAVAPDLFSWGGRIRCIRDLMMDLAARKGASFDDADAVRQWLEGWQDCTGKTGSSVSVPLALLRFFWRPAMASRQSPRTTVGCRTTSMRS